MRNKDDYFQSLATTASKQSTCLSKQVGCVFVSDDNYVLTVGYNGAPKGFEHCEDREGGCNRPNGSCEDTIHAEQNALIQASMRGISLKGSKLYCTLSPCKPCTLTLIQLGITEVHIHHVHSSFPVTLAILDKAGIKVYDWAGHYLNYTIL